MVINKAIAAMRAHLQAHGVTIAPSAIDAFVAEKEHGASEAAFVADAMKAACASEGEKMLRMLAVGTALGAVTGPVVDTIRNQLPGWRKLIKRSPKTMTFGALGGAVVTLAVEQLWGQKGREEAVTTLTDIRRDAHALEEAWAEIITQEAGQQAAGHSKSNSLPLR